MNINLRKASQVLHSIGNTLNDIKVHNSLTFNEFSTNISTELSSAFRTMDGSITRKNHLLKACSDIRNLVYEANYSSGIYKVLAEINQLESMINLLKPVIQEKPAMTNAEIQARITKLSKSESVSRYDSDFETGVLPISKIEEYKQKLAGLKLQKQSLQDKLLTLNVSTEIALDFKTVEVLSSEGII